MNQPVVGAFQAFEAGQQLGARRLAGGVVAGGDQAQAEQRRALRGVAARAAKVDDRRHRLLGGDGLAQADVGGEREQRDQAERDPVACGHARRHPVGRRHEAATGVVASISLRTSGRHEPHDVPARLALHTAARSQPALAMAARMVSSPT